jgi:hypothetical protein
VATLLDRSKEIVMAGARPGGVTLVAVIAWISGVLSLITGILALTAGSDLPAVTTAAWVTIVIGLVTILVGVGLLRGSNAARIVATIVFVLNLANAVWVMFTVPGQFWPAIVSGLLALIGLGLLYTARANEFFRD